MKRVYKGIVFFVLFIGVLHFQGCKIYTGYQNLLRLQNEQTTVVNTGEPRVEHIESYQVVHLYGKPYDMGFQYGTLLKEHLESLALISDALFPEKTLDKYKKIAVEAEVNLPESFRQELKGIVDASGVDYNLLLALNTIPSVDCSGLAVWGDATADGHLIMGRNADYIFGSINKAIGLIVVKHPENRNATVMATFIGMLGGFTGMNEKGVCYGNMLVHNSETKEFNMKGLPIQLLMQLGGENYSTAREMNDAMTRETHMIPINLMVADKDEAILAELNQTSWALREGSSGVLAASNYFYSTGMFAETFDCERFTGLLIDAREYYGKFDVPQMKKSLHKARRRGGQNMQSIIFEPGLNKMHVSMNRVPATLGPYVGLNVQELFSR